MSSPKGRILVTGACGYIGSHTVLHLLNANYDVLAIGNSHPTKEDTNTLPPVLEKVFSLIDPTTPNHGHLSFRKCNLLELPSLKAIFEEEHFSTVIHLASLKGVADSISNPIDFYSNNIIGTLNLINLCASSQIKNFIFISSATVYGRPSELPITELSPTGQNITNPYGRTKHMLEQMLMDIASSDRQWYVTILRLFDPAGAHPPTGELGDGCADGTAPKHLMPFVAQVAMGIRSHLNVYGHDLDTVDGSGARDYIHISDVSQAMVAATDRIRLLKESKLEGRVEVFNIGSGTCFTVLQMVEKFERASGKTIPCKVMDTRPGDIPLIYCDPSLAKHKLLWEPKLTVDDICRDLWKWQQKQ